MGNFTITIKAVGGHGCEREVKDGGTVIGCGRMGCPDCEARRFVERMKTFANVEEATLQHWPGQPEEVRDNLLTKIRTGSFALLVALGLALVALLPRPAFAAEAVPAVDVPAAVVPAAPATSSSDPATAIPDPTVDPAGFVKVAAKAVSDHRWWALLPLGIVGLIAGVRRFGGQKWPILTSPGAGAAMSLACVVCGAFFLVLSAGVTGFLPVVSGALALLAAGYPLFKTLGNLGSWTPAVQTAPAIPVPKAPTPEELAAATAKAEAAAAAGKSATELDAELRAPVKPS